MSDTVLLAAITAIVTIAAGVIAHLDRHHLATRAELTRQLVAEQLASTSETV